MNSTHEIKGKKIQQHNRLDAKQFRFKKTLKANKKNCASIFQGSNKNSREGVGFFTNGRQLEVYECFTPYHGFSLALVSCSEAGSMYIPSQCNGLSRSIHQSASCDVQRAKQCLRLQLSTADRPAVVFVYVRSKKERIIFGKCSFSHNAVHYKRGRVVSDLSLEVTRK